MTTNAVTRSRDIARYRRLTMTDADLAARAVDARLGVTGTDTGYRDSLGTAILVGDTVVIASWGAPVRLADTGRRATVTGLTRAGNLVLDSAAHGHGHDPIAGGRAVRPGHCIVARRDGQPGYEGNRPDAQS